MRPWLGDESDCFFFINYFDSGIKILEKPVTFVTTTTMATVVRRPRLSTRPFAPTGPGQLQVQTFTDQYTLSDGNQSIELYHVEGLNHSDNMLIAYLPKQKILVSA